MEPQLQWKEAPSSEVFFCQSHQSLTPFASLAPFVVQNYYRLGEGELEKLPPPEPANLNQLICLWMAWHIFFAPIPEILHVEYAPDGWKIRHREMSCAKKHVYLRRS